jgi:hypothetical protein
MNQFGVLIAVVLVGALAFWGGRASAPPPTRSADESSVRAESDAPERPAGSGLAGDASGGSVSRPPETGRDSLPSARPDPSRQNERMGWAERSDARPDFTRRRSPGEMRANALAISRAHEEEIDFIRDSLGLPPGDVDRVLQVKEETNRQIVDLLQPGGVDPQRVFELQQAQSEQLREVMGDSAYTKYESFRQGQIEAIRRRVAAER